MKMTQEHANELLIERFDELCTAAEKAAEDGRANDLSILCDSAHKMFITLTNARAFETPLTFEVRNTIS